MSNLSTLPKGDSAWLLRKAIERIIQQISVLETNIGSSTTGNSANTQVIFNDNGVLRGDAGLTYNATTDLLTVASATITGDLTVDTSTLKVDSANNRVGIGTATPDSLLQMAGAGTINWKLSNTSDSVTVGCYAGTNAATTGTLSNHPFFLYTNNTERYRLASDGVATWSNVGGVAGTAMTLNSTGLGVGASPTAKLHVSGTGTQTLRVETLTSGNPTLNLLASGQDTCSILYDRSNNYMRFDVSSTTGALILGRDGNVGVGVTPSAWISTYKALQVSSVAGLSCNSGSAEVLLSNNYFRAASQDQYITTNFATIYQQVSGSHRFYTAPSGTAGNAITFTQAMTLDASGNLLVGTTTNTNNSRVFVRNGNAANPTLALQGITGDVGQAGLLVGKFDNDSTTSQILVRFTINNNAGGSGQINANGASQAAFGSYSDSRLKENIVSLPSQLANILSLRPVEFDYKDGSGHQIGFVAQEMQEVYSDAVGEQNGFLTVTGWSKTEARLVSAIKELAAKVQALEAKLA